MNVRMPGLLITNKEIAGLAPFTSYAMVVRFYCTDDDGVGPPSQELDFRTNATHPSGTVDVIRVESIDDQSVRIEWNHIPADEWNGQPYGYYVYLSPLPPLLPDSTPSRYPQAVEYPSSEHLVRNLSDGNYVVRVIAVNNFAVGPFSANYTAFTIGPVPTPDNDPGFFSSPFVYIIVPGVVFVVICVVITLVLCKKTLEKRKRRVCYCKDIAEKPIAAQIPLQMLSPIPSSSSGVTSPHSHAHSHSSSNRARPLPLSPNSMTSPTPLQSLPEQEPPPIFGNGPSSQPPARKQPHPGPMPQLKQAQPLFASVPMQRTFTDQSTGSVFTNQQVPVQPNPRNRSKAIGGSIPSPYEVPAENGSTLSRSEVAQRPNTAHGIARSQIPPPPCHSPPHLTTSSLELLARIEVSPNRRGVGGAPLQQRVVTDPRGMQHRSHSTSAADRMATMTEGGGMNQMRSAGHLPILETSEEEKMVYIAPPQDSSAENSVANFSDGRASDYRATAPMYLGQANGSIVSSEQYSSFSEMSDSLPPSMPRLPAHYPPPPPPPASDPRFHGYRGHGAGRKRESEFSETSTEMSMSSASGSLRGQSPPVPGWEHRGPPSEVAVGHQRRQPSRSPEVQEHFSEVGTAHHLIKQNQWSNPLPVPYTSPASIVSSTAESTH